jgi:hypothetical protein
VFREVPLSFTTFESLCISARICFWWFGISTVPR